MKRFRFLAALFGFGATAQVLSVHSKTECEAAVPLAWKGSQKPKNNQCPVCGTTGSPPVYLFGGTLARCKNCNAAFWQEPVAEVQYGK